MRDVIIWIFNLVSNFINTSLNWKIYGNFSFTHFILASVFIVALFKFIGFGESSYGELAESGISTFKNIENANDKKNYSNWVLYNKVRSGSTTFIKKRRFKIHKRTGEVKEV